MVAVIYVYMKTMSQSFTRDNPRCQTRRNAVGDNWKVLGKLANRSKCSCLY